MEGDQPPFVIQLQRREPTLSQQRRPHPYLLHSPNNSSSGSANDSSGYSSGSSRLSSKRSNSLDVNNIEVAQNQPQQNNSQFFEAYDCTRCGNIHRKGTVCNAPTSVLQQPSPSGGSQGVFTTLATNKQQQPSPVSTPNNLDSGYSSGSLSNSGPLPTLRSHEALADHEMVQETRAFQSEPLNLAFGTQRPPSRTLRVGNSTDTNAQINPKARLPAKIRMKSHLIQGSNSQSSKPSLRVKKLKDLMAPNSMALRKLPPPLTPMVVESIAVEPDHGHATSAPHKIPQLTAINNKKIQVIKEKQQVSRCDTTVDLIDICDDDIEKNDHATENNSTSSVASPNPNPVRTCLSPKPVVSAATSIFVADPKIEKGISATPRPYLEIVEQPASNSLRFRYRCEGRSAGTLHGASTTGRYSETKTFPKVKIHGFQGPARVAISCVEADAPYRCHPHNIVGKNCTKGICIVNVDETTMCATIPGIGIQCVKKKDMGDSLKIRKQIGIDPFKQGFDEVMNYECNVNLNAIRLAFQAFLDATGASPIPLSPIVSQIIRDKKAYCDLAICDISNNWSPVKGGKKILLFTKKICRTDIEVHISYINPKTKETKTFKAPFKPSDVHEQCGIKFFTPPFPDQGIENEVLTQLCLYKPSDFTQSEPVNFYYYPKDDCPEDYEPVSDDEGVDTSEMVDENDEEEDEVRPMKEFDPPPCDEDYDNYDSERILQIDETDHEESVVDSVSNLIDFFGEEEDSNKSDSLQEKKPEKIAIEPPRQHAISVNGVLNMNQGQISSIFLPNNGSNSSKSINISSSSRKKEGI